MFEVIHSLNLAAQDKWVFITGQLGVVSLAYLFIGVSLFGLSFYWIFSPTGCPDPDHWGPDAAWLQVTPLIPSIMRIEIFIC